MVSINDALSHPSAASGILHVNVVACGYHPALHFLTQGTDPLLESTVTGASLVTADMAQTMAERGEKLEDAAAVSLVSVGGWNSSTHQVTALAILEILKKNNNRSRLPCSRKACPRQSCSSHKAWLLASCRCCRSYLKDLQHRKLLLQLHLPQQTRP